MMERKGPMVALRNEDGAREVHKAAVLSSETALAAFRDAARYPEIELVRRELLDWRLYHDFRTDEASPIRQPCHAITTPTLSADGHDLAAVLATLFVIREDTVDLRARDRRCLSRRAPRRRGRRKLVPASRCGSPTCRARSARMSCPTARSSISACSAR